MSFLSRIVVVGCLTACGSVAWSQEAALPLPPKTVYKPVRILEQPSTEMLDANYPARAKRAFLPGRGTVDCRVGADGAPAECMLESEFPPGQGFGDAAMKIARALRFDPAGAGETVSIPLLFKPAKNADVRCDVTAEHKTEHCKLGRQDPPNWATQDLADGGNGRPVDDLKAKTTTLHLVEEISSEDQVAYAAMRRGKIAQGLGTDDKPDATPGLANLLANQTPLPVAPNGPPVHYSPPSNKRVILPAHKAGQTFTFTVNQASPKPDAPKGWRKTIEVSLLEPEDQSIRFQLTLRDAAAAGDEKDPGLLALKDLPVIVAVSKTGETKIRNWEDVQEAYWRHRAELETTPASEAGRARVKTADKIEPGFTAKLQLSTEISIIHATLTAGPLVIGAVASPGKITKIGDAVLYRTSNMRVDQNPERCLVDVIKTDTMGYESAVPGGEAAPPFRSSEDTRIEAILSTEDGWPVKVIWADGTTMVRDGWKPCVRKPEFANPLPYIYTPPIRRQDPPKVDVRPFVIPPSRLPPPVMRLPPTPRP